MLVDLMKDGIIDQLVGEDGHFYYKLTEKGKAKGRKLKLPDHIKRLFKDKGKDEM
jgi:DNA-binding PadR family transcriptional regulator